MIVYRIQATTGDGWVNTFEPLKADAIRAGRELAEIYDEPGAVHVDAVNVPDGREGIASALQLADANRMNWPGEEVWRS